MRGSAMEEPGGAAAKRPGVNGPSIVMIGGGQASYVAAKALRQNGFEGPISIVGEEAHPPYERPPLSKAVLLGSSAPETTYLASRDVLAAAGIEMVHDVAVSIDRAARVVRTRSGPALRYDHLLIATGGRARCLEIPGSDLAGVHYLRALQDVHAIRESLASGRPLVVIGGGWIGLEVAASARSAGAQVTVVEAADRLCARSLPPEAAAFLLDLHRANGVDVRLGASLAAITGGESVSGVELATGERLEAGAVVVGVGMIPNAELARDAGLLVNQGILVDECGRTSDPAIHAAGDVAELRIGESSVRIESWANANEQAAAVAAAILGHPIVPRPPAWFWSDQHGVNIQVLGTFKNGLHPVLIGDPAARACTWCYGEEDRLACVVACNRSRDVQAARRIMQRGIAVSKERLAEPGIELVRLL